MCQLSPSAAIKDISLYFFIVKKYRKNMDWYVQTLRFIPTGKLSLSKFLVLFSPSCVACAFVSLSPA